MKKRPREVLIVDDELNICNALRRILRKEGYLVKAVRDGNSALDIICKKRIDVILLDLMMPGVNGREICSIARHLAAETKVVYFSAFSCSNMGAMKELADEADGFIRKPASSQKILAELHAVLNSPVKTHGRGTGHIVLVQSG